MCMQASLMNQLDNISTARSILFLLLHIEKVLFARSFLLPRGGVLLYDTREATISGTTHTTFIASTVRALYHTAYSIVDSDK
jgi:hypothetical protein